MALPWKVIGVGTAGLAAAAADRVLHLTWEAATGRKPPTVPEDPETDWREAVAWALVSGAVIGLVRLVATRRAAAYYARSTGSLPKALRRSA
ncbi:MAG: DUF4235 domain-containing protein [Kineosporiaceae bacterium]